MLLTYYNSTKAAAPRFAGTVVGHARTLTVRSAVKRPSQLLPPTEDKSVQSLIETGIRGTLAMVAAGALQLDVFSHIHWHMDDIVTGMQFAAPCVAMDLALLLLYTTLDNKPSTQQQLADQDVGPVTGADTTTELYQRDSDKATLAAALLAAMDAVYLHDIRYSLLGAASPAARLSLEAGAQASEELLTRGALLGAASTWLTNRSLEASLCGDQPLLLPLGTLGSASATSSAAATAAELLPCGTGPQWLAAAALCAIMASRFIAHSNSRAAAARSERDAAAAEAAARRAVLRYEPLAVQQAAAAAAGGHVGSEIDAEAAERLAAGEAEAVERLAQTWLGARFVLGQACMFGAYIATDNLLASFSVGLLLQVVSSVCCERYLLRVTAP